MFGMSAVPYSNQRTSRSDRRRVEARQHEARRNRLETPRARSRRAVARTPHMGQIRPHNIRFNNRPSPRGIFARYDSRGLLMLAATILILFLVIFGLVGCIRGCVSPKTADDQASKKTNSLDSRVAYGASEEITAELGDALDKSEDLTWIASHADEYSDDAIIRLAIRESAAASFVRQVPNHDKKAQSYDEEVVKGTYPELYCWDERWGYVEYGGLPLGVSGSGPTVLFIATMGLTGSAEATPADIASIATEAGYDTGDARTSGALFTSAAGQLGLECTAIECSDAGLTTALTGGYVVAIETGTGTLTDEAHWVLAYATNGDGTIAVIDPTSIEATSRGWAAKTLGSGSTSMFALKAASS